MHTKSIVWKNCIMSNQIQSAPFTCPACGLLCDDITPSNNTCAKSIAFFGQKLGETNPQIKGQKVSLQEAVSAAAKILKNSQKSLFAGLSTDITGFKALESLAQKTNASLMHINAQSMARNLKVLQSSGWQTTTLTEVKNRADLIVCIGNDIVSHNPRFFERFVDVEGMFVTKREVIYLATEHAPEGSWLLPCGAVHLPEVLAALHALVLGKTLKASHVAGLAIADLQALANKLKTSKYAVLTWIAKDLDFPHAELAIQQITQLVATLNHTTRAAGLPLGGSDGDTSSNNIHTWRNGVILDDAPAANIHASAGDAVVWINSFSAEKLPPKNDVPTIFLGNSNSVLGNANSVFATPPDVFIPVATPGLDCDGALFRVDGAVILPLKKVRKNDLPTLAEILHQIESLL